MVLNTQVIIMLNRSVQMLSVYTRSVWLSSRADMKLAVTAELLHVEDILSSSTLKVDILPMM